MRYVNQLNDNQLVELIKIYAGDTFKSLVEIDRYDDSIDITVEIEFYDEDECRNIILEDMYTLYDYHVKIWDYYAYNQDEMLREYRKRLLDYFGHQYATDYLIKEQL